MPSEQWKNQVRDHDVKKGFVFFLSFLFLVFSFIGRQQGFDSLLGAARVVLNLFPGDRWGDGNGGGGGGRSLAGIDPNSRSFNIKDNAFSDNKGDTVGFKNFGNSGPYSGNSENNKMKENEGKTEGFQDSGNDYSGNSKFNIENNKMTGNEGKTQGFQDFGNYYRR